MKKESIEEFLKRGGKILKAARGDSGLPEKFLNKSPLTPEERKKYKRPIK